MRPPNTLEVKILSSRPVLVNSGCEIRTQNCSYLLVVETLDLERLDDIGDELRVDVCVPDLLVQELPHRALGLGRDLLAKRSR